VIDSNLETKLEIDDEKEGFALISIVIVLGIYQVNFGRCKSHKSFPKRFQSNIYNI
jgi:hypothetical protein